MSWVAAVRKQARKQFNCVKRISLLFLIKLDNRMWGIPLGGQTISQRGREKRFKCVYLCCMCVWSHTDPWAEWLRPRLLPHLLVWLNDNSRASVPAWMPSSWHAVRWICFEIKNNMTTELDYIIRYLDGKTRLSVILGIYLNFFCTFAIAQILSWAQRFGFLDLYGDDWFQEPPRLEKSSNHHNYGVIKWQWIQLFSSRHFISPACSAANIIIRLYNTWHFEGNSAVSGTYSHI